ncbi:MAG: bifunctional phosphoribosylaminoimidazolecarboxamide formyltransferase/IMP cyclohydrolase [Caldilinea sp.]|jgi:phosphoribosylaminoimidazolecarboxamide formyltransferase/IMP cyclohydrolase|nr:bifunctional phosphoribosylaminoimidazolecarboxamide formyltransferase/IMP cyclohydrolase [Caldilinea sp.]
MPSFRALLSVSDKTGLDAFARQLVAAGGELIASGGTARQLAAAGLPVQTVETVTGFPEILGGRVKTLHPAIHGAILARRTAGDLDELAQHRIRPIDLVVVNLYPFQQTVAHPNVALSAAIEEIDIGGVALLRAAAKNHADVTVVCDPTDYPALADALAAGGVGAQLRRRLAVKAFQHTAAYDTAIAAYLVEEENPTPAAGALPDALQLDLALIQRNRYGENPHQAGALYGYAKEPPAFAVLHGKEMSYNNWLDLDSSWLAAQDFAAPTAAIVKHGNPCGLACAETLEEAYSKALASDPVSAFGGVLAVNRPLDLGTAQRLFDLFLEVVAAPAYEPEALALLQKKKNVRILRAWRVPLRPFSLRSIIGGVLVQEADRSEQDMDPAGWQVVSQRQPAAAQRADLAFAWRAARHVKSNAIVYAKNLATVGVGAGQMSRIDSVMMAGHKAGERSLGAVMASDAFFPFADGIEAAARHGVAAVVQPGGSVRDQEVIAAADRLGLVLCFTGVRHFRH